MSQAYGTQKYRTETDAVKRYDLRGLVRSHLSRKRNGEAF